jgi:hypothetical protein
MNISGTIPRMADGPAGRSAYSDLDDDTSDNLFIVFVPGQENLRFSAYGSEPIAGEFLKA